MCGIIGYVGFKKALPFLLSGLKDLEYRGYDSCWVAILENQKIRLIKNNGEVDLLVKKTWDQKINGTMGIGHTRWATHGRPSKINAHPHLDCTKKIAVVHNGIIENFEELKEELLRKGHRFVSETDTELLPHLIEENIKKENDLLKAVGRSLKRLIGAYGLAVISADFPGQIVIARLSSPLILGFGQKENYLASDQPALLPWAKEMANLKNGQLAKITAESVTVKTLDGQSAKYQKIFLKAKTKKVSKKGYDHYMIKEIKEQPEVLKDGLRGRISSKKGIKLGGIDDYMGKFINLRYLPIVACGTSYHASLVGKHYFQQLAGLPVLVENATELVGQSYPWPEKKPVIFVSQSGETADVLAVARQAVKKGVVPFGLVNIAGSSLARETKAGVYMRAGYEIGVAATKTFTAQMLVFMLWAGLIGVRKKRFKKSNEIYKRVEKLPFLVGQTLKTEKEIKKLAGKLAGAKKIYLLGRGPGYALALEGALKIKEIAYLPAEAIPAGELKHGPLALVDSKTVLLFLVPNDEYFKKNLNAIVEAEARGGRILVLTNKKDMIWRKRRLKTYYFPGCHPLLAAFPMAVWLQLLSYHLGLQLGRSIDKPRNLAKSVTVE